MILDPFYGVFKADTEISKWLNRLLLLTEVSVAGFGLYSLWSHCCLEYWRLSLVTVGCYFAIAIINLIIRKLWDVVMVVIYGTTDADTILQNHNDRLARRQRRRMKRQERLMVEAERTQNTNLTPKLLQSVSEFM